MPMGEQKLSVSRRIVSADVSVDELACKYFPNSKELAMKMNLLPVLHPLRGIILALLSMSVPLALNAQETGGIRVKVDTFLPAELISGPHYTMAPKAEVRRAIAFFKLDTSYGKTEVAGTVALLERIDELRAIATLENMKKTDVYTDALKKSAGGPLDTAKALVDDPLGTVSDTAKGLGSFFADIGYAIVSDDPSQENVAKTALGFGAAKRKLAHQLGVNPYSSFEPLQDHMSEIAWTMVGGGLTVTAAFSQIGNTAGQVADNGFHGTFPGGCEGHGARCVSNRLHHHRPRHRGGNKHR